MNTKTLRLLSWITLVAFVPTSAVFAAPAGQITQSSGYVAVSAPQSAPKSAGSGDAVENGQTVTLGDGARAVIKFQDGQIIALQSKSVFKVNSYKYDRAAPEKGESFFSLLQGGLRAITGLIGSNNKAGWKLATPTATIGIRGTDFMVVINQSVYLKVDAGAISATNSAGTAVFTAGQTAAVASGTTLGTVVPACRPGGHVRRTVGDQSGRGRQFGSRFGGGGRHRVRRSDRHRDRRRYRRCGGGSGGRRRWRQYDDYASLTEGQEGRDGRARASSDTELRS